MTQLSFARHARRLASHFIGLAFGGLWATVAVATFAPQYRPLAMALAVLITLGCCLRLWTRPYDLPSQQPFFRARVYLLSVLCEVAAIWIASATFPRFRLTPYLGPAAGFIVGLHFIGLWRASGSRRFLSIAAGMCLVSFVSAILPLRWGTVQLRYAFLGTGNALVLWIGALAKEKSGTRTVDVRFASDSGAGG